MNFAKKQTTSVETNSVQTPHLLFLIPEKVPVLLHGFLENQSIGYSYSDFFQKKNRVITIDLLGH
jgi:hypothetical protein